MKTPKKKTKTKKKNKISLGFFWTHLSALVRVLLDAMMVRKGWASVIYAAQKSYDLQDICYVRSVCESFKISENWYGTTKLIIIFLN